MTAASQETSIEFRRAQGDDFESMVALQNLYLANNLADDQKKDGFLSVGFSQEQFKAMNDNLLVVVGTTTLGVKAFLCASTVEFNLPLALPKAMIDEFPNTIYENKPLSEWNICIAGPVCVDASLRGQGVLDKLYSSFYDLAPPQYELAVVFVSVDNPRSIRAHEKVGMSVVGNFEFKGHQHVIMAGKIR